MHLFSRFGAVFAFVCVAQLADAQTSQSQDEVFADRYAEAAAPRELILSGDYASGAVLALPLAKAGNPVAQNLMGIVLENNGDPDLSPAVQMYELAMAQQYPKAFHNLALLYLEDRPTFPADPARAVELYRDAAALGYQPSHEEWVWHLMWGGDGVEDHALAFAQGQIGVEAYPDSLQLKNLLADTHYYGMGTDIDVVAALALYKASAELGSAYGQFSVGYQYFVGQGTPINTATARDYFERAAEQDYGDAFGYLAYIYYYGDDVEPDYDLAFAYASRGDGRDDGQAAFFIGEAYADGQGAPQDYEIAREIYERSYDEGYTYALYRLGDMAYFGRGEPVNYEKAFGMFERVVAENPVEVDAVYSLGYMLMRGEGAAIDLARAVGLIEDAVSMGDWYSMGEAILLYGGDDYFGDHSSRVQTAAHCMHATAEGFLADQDEKGEINTICTDTMRDLSQGERAQAKDIAQNL